MHFQKCFDHDDAETTSRMLTLFLTELALMLMMMMMVMMMMMMMMMTVCVADISTSGSRRWRRKV